MGSELLIVSVTLIHHKYRKQSTLTFMMDSLPRRAEIKSGDGACILDFGDSTWAKLDVDSGPM